MGGGRWIEDPLYLLLSEEVVNLSQIPLLEGSTKLQLGTNEVGAVVRTDFNRFSATSDEALKGIYEGVRLTSMWMALVVRQVKRHPYLLSSLRFLFTRNGPK